ncbi:putative membrane protein [Bacillus thuringiensis serovar morrisoni]|nr:putative membrane protein [Bacillus thuringiensis serovar morrisoni]
MFTKCREVGISLMLIPLLLIACILQAMGEVNEK